MSVKNTISLVRSFVQSDVCKALKHDDDDVSYLFSGRETPIRSCGCKAQRVLDRTRRFREKPEPDCCADIWFQVNYCVFFEKNRGGRQSTSGFPYVTCRDCSTRVCRNELWVERFVYPKLWDSPSMSGGTVLSRDKKYAFLSKSGFEPIKGHIGDYEHIGNLPNDLSPEHKMYANVIRRNDEIRWYPRLGHYLHREWNRAPWQHERWACDLCFKGVVNIRYSECCGECYMSRPAVPSRRFQWQSESEDEEELMDLQWEVPRNSTPEPSIQVVEENDNAVVDPEINVVENPPSPNVLLFEDLSDNDRLQYMLEYLGYHY